MPKDKTLIDYNHVVMTEQPSFLELERPLRFLSAKEIGLIDEFLATFEDQGELKLVVHKGRLRFVTHTRDFDIVNDES